MRKSYAGGGEVGAFEVLEGAAIALVVAHQNGILPQIGPIVRALGHAAIEGKAGLGGDGFDAEAQLLGAAAIDVEQLGLG